MQVIAVSTKDIILSKTYDGFPIVVSKDICGMEFDYIIVTSHVFFDEILVEAMSLGISREKIVDGRVFCTPNFDFGLYVNLIKQPITIFSDDCWGGSVYSYYFLQMNSPFINMYIEKDDYLQFLSDPDYYLSSEVQCLREGDVFYSQHPLGFIGDGDRKIILHFNHHSSFLDAALDWNRRKIRVNKNNIFVKMTLSESKRFLIERMEELPYCIKAIFVPERLPEYRSTVYCPNYVRRLQEKRAAPYAPFGFDAYVRDISTIAREIDLLKMLNGMRDFNRYE